MRFLFYFLLLSLLYQCNTPSTTWHNLNYKQITYAPYHFQLLLDTNVRGQRIVPYIDITSTKGYFSQRIYPTDVPFEEYLEDSTILQFRDVNFDGYPDIMVLNWLSTNYQKSYDYWRYEPNLDSFISDTCLTPYWNPIFDSTTQTIISKSRIGCCDYDNYTLNWRNDTVFILEQESISQDIITPPHHFYYYQEVWINDKQYIGEGILKMISDSIFIDSTQNTPLHFSKNISINLQLYWVEGDYKLKEPK